MEEVLVSRVTTPLGDGFIARTASGIVMLETGMSERDFVRAAGDRLGAHPVRRDLAATVRRRLEASIARGDGVEVDWASLPDFQRKVLRATARIPLGQVRSYGEVATAIRTPRAARAVGTALAKNPIPLLIPCHRVVRAGGELGNYGLGGTAVKRRLLEAEGAISGERTSSRRGSPAA